MAKHKGQQALFDLLRKDRPEVQAAKPAPMIRRTAAVGPAPVAAPVAAPRPVEAPRPEPVRMAMRKPLAEPSAPLLLREVSLPVSWLLIGLVAVGCLAVIAFVVGQRYGTERLPDVPKHPTINEIRQGPVTPDLVTKGPAQPLPGSAASGARPAAPPKGRPAEMPKPVAAEKASAPASPRPTVAEKSAGPTAVRPGGAEKPVMTETPAPSGPQFRVRIAQLAVSQPDAIDKMRGFLLQKDIETELETSRGFYVLYSRDRFSDKKKADETAARINKQLDAFEKATKIPTSKTAYVTQMTKE
jgi:type IV secretory pathway VirB10-like protein